MLIKKELSLLSNKPNIFDFPQSSIDTYKIDDNDKEHIVSELKVFTKKTTEHLSHKYVIKQLNTDLKFFDFVKMSKYPLPVVYNIVTKRIIINLFPLGRHSILNILPRDLYTLVFYGHICAYFSSGISNMPESSLDIVTDYISSLFLKLFSKKYGLTGSYTELIPQLRFLISLYVQTSFFEFSKDNALHIASRNSKLPIEQLNIDINQYDFSKTKDFIKSLNDSGVFPGINTYVFISTVIRYFGVLSVPMFEDFMRFCCTLCTSTVNENTIIPTTFVIYQKNLFDSIVLTITKEI